MKTYNLNFQSPDEIKEFIKKNQHDPDDQVLVRLKVLSELIFSCTKDMEDLLANIEESKQRYESLFENNSDVVYSTDLYGNFTSVNRAFKTTFEYTEEEVLHKKALDFIKKKDIPIVKKYFYKTLDGKEQIYSLEIPTKSGEIQLFNMKNIPIIVNEKVVGIFGIGSNITKQKLIEEKISYLAYYDLQTDLPNRLKFTEILKNYLNNNYKNQQLAVLFVDIDRFKLINDTFGHYVGDEILKLISIKLKASLPIGSKIGRFDGDKFVVLFFNNAENHIIKEITNDILQEISSPILYNNQEFFVTASIGVSISPRDGLDEHTLLKNADIAMNRAKLLGGNQIQFYSTEMNQQVSQRLELESYLRRAIEKNEFYLCYQPLVNLSSGEIFGSEALLRWKHPKLGLVSPADFIPLAEETSLIYDIGKWVLHTACKQNKIWQEKGLGDLSISINVSANQFQRSSFINEVKQALNESGLDPQYLNLELTESVMLRNVSYIISIMKELREIGVKVSIDDFGTGYSSLSYLKNLPINTLKIDRSFINNLKVDTSDIAIVQAIITMGQWLEIEVVAEGVESKEQMNLLKDLRCHYAQGFYIHKPLSAEDFEKGVLKSR